MSIIVEFIFKLGTNDGYCLIKIDGKKIIEKFNYDNDLDPNEQIVSRFGPFIAMNQKILI